MPTDPGADRSEDSWRLPEDIAVPLERDGFLRDMLRGLSGTLEQVVGLEEAAGFISVVGRDIGHRIDRDYRTALGVERLDVDQLAGVLVDLKRRIQGDFYVLEVTDERIVLGNRRCPFEDRVADRPSLCMMTSNVFGVIAAENTGYARVDLEETIAEGASGCRVVIHLTPTEDRVLGREYFRT